MANTKLDTYTPMADLFDKITAQFAIKNDAALARFLKLAPPILCKLRHGRNQPSGDNLIRIHMATEIPIKELVRLVNYDAVGHSTRRSARGASIT